MTTELTVTATILQQLGGNRFIAMTGAKNFLALADGKTLRFKLPKGATRGINIVEIKLTYSDTYTLKFYKVSMRTTTFEPKVTRDFVYADQLRDVFTSETGLAVAL